MSGSNSYRYRVIETEAQRETRRRRELEEEGRQLQSEWRRLHGDAERAARRHGGSVLLPQEPSIKDLRARDNDEFERRLEKSRSGLGQARAALDQSVVNARRDAMIGRLSRDVSTSAPVDTAGSALARQRVKRAGRPAADSGPDVEESSAETVARITGRLRADVPADVDARIEDVARSALSARTGATAQLQLDNLRLAVQEANRVADRRETRLAELNEFRRRLAGRPGPGAARLLERLDALEKTGNPVTPELRAEIASACTAAKQESDRQQVTSALRNSLEALGYEVGGRFETLLVERGYADAHLPEWKGYAVRVRLPQGDALNLNVVKGEAASALSLATDREVQQSLCDRLPRFINEMARHGIEPRLTRQVAPEDIGVQVANDFERPEGRGAEAARRKDDQQATGDSSDGR